MLSWPSPALGSQESSRDYIARAEIYRLIEARDDEPVLDIDDYEETAEVIGYIDRVTMEGLAKSLGGMQYTDSIDIAGARERRTSGSDMPCATSTSGVRNLRSRTRWLLNL